MELPKTTDDMIGLGSSVAQEMRKELSHAYGDGFGLSDDDLEAYAPELFYHVEHKFNGPHNISVPVCDALKKAAPGLVAKIDH